MANQMTLRTLMRLTSQSLHRRFVVRHSQVANRPSAHSRLALELAHRFALRAFRGLTRMSQTPASSARRASPLRYVALALAASAIAIAGYFAYGTSQRVPDATFTLLSGQKVSTADLKGKVYLVNF